MDSQRLVPCTGRVDESDRLDTAGVSCSGEVGGRPAETHRQSVLVPAGLRSTATEADRLATCPNIELEAPMTSRRYDEMRWIRNVG